MANMREIRERISKYPADTQDHKRDVPHVLVKAEKGEKIA